jgi:murein L,D-transpeptidase YcbB/YkuD
MTLCLLPGRATADTIATPPPTPPAAGLPPISPADASAIDAALRQAATQGLVEPDMAGALEAISGPDPTVRAAAGGTLGDAAVRLAKQQHGLIADPRAIDANFALREPYDATAEFAAARATGQVGAWIAALAPPNPLFQNLSMARARYAAIVAAGGWDAIAPGRPPRLGKTDPRLAALRLRLAAEGYDAAPKETPDLFDAPLQVALDGFQQAHGLKPDGVLSPETLAELNISAAARLAAIDANLERERWLPRQLPPDRIEVDIGGPAATLFRNGTPALSMRAIVGKPSTETPIFVSQVTAILFNPPWVVPTDIAAHELWPKERRSPGYFARNDYYVSGGQVIQRAGPKSALGHLKFDMPDPFTVYLHDTPSRSLFKRAQRWLSHGCVRLEQPRELATALLAPQGWDRDAVDAAIAEGTTHRVQLTVQPPVFVVYRTVTAMPDGRASFRPDVYGWDAKVEAALAAAAPGVRAAPP